MAATKKAQVSKAKTAKKTTKTSKAKLDTKNAKDTVEKVVRSKRQIKYNYPRAIKTPTDRKAWRQQVRTKLNRLELKMAKATAAKDKAAAAKAVAAYRTEVLLVP